MTKMNITFSIANDMTNSSAVNFLNFSGLIYPQNFIRSKKISILTNIPDRLKLISSTRLI